MTKQTDTAIPFEDFEAEVQRRKRERWARILAAESPGRVAGRRPRDPLKEALLLRLDRARLARDEMLARQIAERREMSGTRT